MKGQQEAITAILITGILLGTVTAVYFWGVPIIQKNQDKVILSETEKFVFLVNEKIKDIAMNGGSTRVPINVPAIVKFDGEKILTTLELSTTIYETQKWIPFFETCNMKEKGKWGKNRPEVLCAFSESIGKNKHKIQFILGYRTLSKDVEDYTINLTGKVSSGGRGHEVTIMRKMVEKKDNKINTIIDISIV